MAESKYSSQIKNLRDNYVRFPLDFKPDELELFRELCAKNGTTATAVIKQAVRDYIARHQ